ncbi:TPA: hypothetical protein I9059_001154 [Clostridium perfringens]|nr:hypothetical protein [Clostridium perfringens]
MQNIKLIYNSVKAVRVDIKKKPIVIEINREKIDSDVLLYIVGKIKFLLNYKLLKFNVLLKFKKLSFADKITYLMLDGIIYDLFKRTNFNIAIICDSEDKDNLHNDGFSGTALYRTMRKVGYLDKKTFLEEYEKKIYNDQRTYRRFLDRETLNDKETPSIINSEVASVLKSYSNNEEWIDSISEVASELVCNVSSHADGDCILDINFNDNIKYNGNNMEESCTLVNISIMNFGEDRLFDKLKRNIKDKKYSENDKLYKKVYRAYDNHKHLFDERYTENHFFLITAFQNHVTTRSFKSGNSGTGLTRLIENIIGISKEDYSYVLSGEEILIFKSEFLKVSDEKFIGFNKESDYINFKPEDRVLNKSRLYIPGTIYNLLLIKEN